jgi:hypothetical protein
MVLNRQIAVLTVALTGLSGAGPVRAAFDVELVTGSGATNISQVGLVYSATGTAATVGVDDLFATLNTLGSAELNTGDGGAEPGDISSANFSITGVYTFATSGTLWLNAAAGIELGTGSISFHATGLDAPGVRLTATNNNINLHALTSTSDSGSGGAVFLDMEDAGATVNVIDTRSVGGTGGAFTMLSPDSFSFADIINLGQVRTGSDGLSSSQNSGNGGNITIGEPNESTRFGFDLLDTSSEGDASAGDGGDVLVENGGTLGGTG